MYYVYVLRSLKQQSKFYIGYTSNLKERLKQHNVGESFHTKKYMPWEILYYEAYTSANLAKNRETKLKHHGKGFAELRKRILEDKKVRG